MDTSIFISWAPATRISPAFFPASAVGDEIGNYAIASAGTITNKSNSDTTGNFNTATESVCPKGWTLPSKKQQDNNRDTTNFTPVLGGGYSVGVLSNESTHGLWWGSDASSSARRRYLEYRDGNLYTTVASRHSGIYVRCVSEEKTVTDLTYLQDMTGEIANKRCRIFYLP